MISPASKAPPNAAGNPRWRFSLRALFKATLYVAVAVGIWKLIGPLPFIFVALFAAPVIFTPRERSRELRALKSAAAYLVVSIVTLPFLDSVWLGEIPVLALTQTPKAELFDAIQFFLIADVMPRFGLSRGSMSPDLIASAPFALALTYLLPLCVMLIVIAWRTRMKKPYCYWAAILAMLAVMDYIMVRAFASGPGLTLY